MQEIALWKTGVLEKISFPKHIRTKMARNGMAFTAHFPASQASLQNTAPHNSKHFTFTYDDLYNCLYRHNELQLIDIEAFKAQRKSSQTEAEKQKETSKTSCGEVA